MQNRLRPIASHLFLGLEAEVFHHRSASRDGQGKSLDGRDKSLKIAVQALNKSQDTEVIRRDNLIVNANMTVEEAFKASGPRYNFYRNFLFAPQANPLTA